ncbi:hypothetical protein SAMN05216480_106151 [Pustulibacterium marinum]|uniref:Uncharacterized protein n=1 Tax=Pustulibacterium marinum TaxID=1224947 RepID=A0A1I7H0E9_9FLAO|nr:hypothetical protein [Pustulibacterium marinum]SFU54112.1 hypothetical protein SAMN05216480_106151 [Pustulibacterium marinum]
MELTKDIFFEHETSITDDNWKVDLSYESSNAKNKKIELSKNNPIIQIANEDFYSAIRIDVTNNNGSTKSCILSGIDGAFILYPKSAKENEGQSIIIKDDTIILSLGFTLICMNLNNLSINWKIRPDMAEIFEFYDLEKDLLLRGEIGIHRIDLNGNIKWTFSARDIWVNTEGKKEVKIENNAIRLFDWESNEYLIDFNGKIIEDKPFGMRKETQKKWWKW